MTKHFSHKIKSVIILAKLELAQRYKRSIVGVWWSLLNPLLTVFIFFFVFQELITIQGIVGIDYLIYIISGVIVVLFSIQTVTQLADSLAAKINLVTKIKLDPFLLTSGVLSAGVFNFFVAFVPFIVLLLFTIPFNFKLLLLFPLVVWMSFFLYSFGLLIALAYALFDDAKPLIRIFISFLPYLTPVFYSINQLPSNVKLVVELSPITIFLKYFRWTIDLENDFNLRLFWIHFLALSALASLFLYIFKKAWPEIVKAL